MRQTGRVDHLDGIRGLAIAAVLALHWASWYVPVLHGGSVGVDVFFVLSGFVITTVLWRSPATWTQFVRRRVVRLYPALVGLVVSAFVLYALVPGAPLGALEVARRGVLTLLQAPSVWAAGQTGSLWLPALHPFGQTWSLAVEWYFYLLWPALLLRARTAGWSAGRLAGWSVAAAVGLYAASVPLPTFVFYFGPLARSAELLAGAALALWMVDHRPSARAARTAPVLALAAVSAYVVLGPDGQTAAYRFVGVPVAVVAALVLVRSGYACVDGVAQRLLARSWLTALGRVSYSLYLWHVVPFVLLEDVALPKPVLGLVAVSSALALAWASHRWLERPFLRPRSDVLAAAPAREPVAESASAPAEHPAPQQRGHQVVRGALGGGQPDPLGGRAT